MGNLLTLPERNWEARMHSLPLELLSSIDIDETVWIPPLLPASSREAIYTSGILETLHRFLQPAPMEWLIPRVSLLLAHYSLPKMFPHLDAIVDDWVHVLTDLPAHAITAACYAVLARPEPWKPTPGEVRALALEEVANARKTLQKLEAMLAIAPAECVAVEVLWPLVRRREIRRIDVEKLVRPVTITLFPKYLVARMHRSHPALTNPAERGSTESLLRRAAEILGREECYLVGPEDPEPAPLAAEKRAQARQMVQTFLTRYKKGYSLPVQSPLGGRSQK